MWTTSVRNLVGLSALFLIGQLAGPVYCAPLRGIPAATSLAPSSAGIRQANSDRREKTIPPDKAAPIPADWTTYTDAEKGYQLKLPKGTGTDSRVVDGFDRFIASVPEPGKAAVMVISFNESRFTKDELLEAAKRTLEKLGESNIKVDSRTAISDDYELAHLTSTSASGMVTRLKVLLGTNGTDNYVMLVGSPEASFRNDEREIDAIWSSFVMLGRPGRTSSQL